MPPPAAQKQAVFATWHKTRAAAEERMAAPPRKISLDRKRFAPYLEKLGIEQKLEDLFLGSLRERISKNKSFEKAWRCYGVRPVLMLKGGLYEKQPKYPQPL